MSIRIRKMALCVLCLLCIFAMSVTLGIQTAKANDDAVSDGTFVMEESNGLRVNSKGGISYTLKMSSEIKKQFDLRNEYGIPKIEYKTLYFIVAPIDVLDDCVDNDYYKYFTETLGKEFVAVYPETIYFEGGYYYTKLNFNNVLSYNYDRDFLCIACYEESEGNYVYTKQMVDGVAYELSELVSENKLKNASGNLYDKLNSAVWDTYAMQVTAKDGKKETKTIDYYDAIFSNENYISDYGTQENPLIPIGETNLEICYDYLEEKKAIEETGEQIILEKYILLPYSDKDGNAVNTAVKAQKIIDLLEGKTVEASGEEDFVIKKAVTELSERNATVKHCFFEEYLEYIPKEEHYGAITDGDMAYDFDCAYTCFSDQETDMTKQELTEFAGGLVSLFMGGNAQGQSFDVQTALYDKYNEELKDDWNVDFVMTLFDKDGEVIDITADVLQKFEIYGQFTGLRQCLDDVEGIGAISFVGDTWIKCPLTEQRVRKYSEDGISQCRVVMSYNDFAIPYYVVRNLHEFSIGFKNISLPEGTSVKIDVVMYETEKESEVYEETGNKDIQGTICYTIPVNSQEHVVSYYAPDGLTLIKRVVVADGEKIEKVEVYSSYYGRYELYAFTCNGEEWDFENDVVESDIDLIVSNYVVVEKFSPLV